MPNDLEPKMRTSPAGTSSWAPIAHVPEVKTAEAANLLNSGELVHFLLENKLIWNQDDWLTFLERLRSIFYKTPPDDEIRRLLESTKTRMELLYEWVQRVKEVIHAKPPRDFPDADIANYTISQVGLLTPPWLTEFTAQWTEVLDHFMVLAERCPFEEVDFVVCVHCHPGFHFRWGIVTAGGVSSYYRPPEGTEWMRGRYHIFWKDGRVSFPLVPVPPAPPASVSEDD